MRRFQFSTKGCSSIAYKSGNKESAISDDPAFELQKPAARSASPGPLVAKLETGEGHRLNRKCGKKMALDYQKASK